MTPSGRRGGRVLKPAPKNKYGHLKVTLSRSDGPNVTVDVHWLVTRAFLGEPEPGEETRHGKGPVSNNRLDNLSYGTFASNQQDRLRDGTDNRGARNGKTKLTVPAVREIRRRRANGEPLATLAQEFKVSYVTISAVAHRRLWAWLD